MNEEQIRKREESQKIHDKKLIFAGKRNNEKLPDLLACINKVLSDNEIEETINESHVIFGGEMAGNFYPSVKDKKLTQIVFNHAYPKPTGKFFSHFTGYEKATGIIQSGSFHVYNLEKNASEEYYKFYQAHNLLGYEEQKELLWVKTSYSDNRSSIFSLSFTSPENESDAMWERFAENYHGVKLTFKIKDNSDYFRKIHYSKGGQKIKLLDDLNCAIKNQFETQFSLFKISKMGAFYIESHLDYEEEYRFIHDPSADKSKFKICKNEEGNFYAVVPFTNKAISFKLIEVKRGYKCSKENFAKLKILTESKFGKKIKFIE
jgi:hypothetical protein